MKKLDLLCATALAMTFATPAIAQNPPQDAEEAADDGEIIVTAQRQAQSLQDVPIAVSAFSAEQLEKQQIENASDLQLTLPNVTFTKGNFTGSSFTIRGIGDLCVGTACDSATGIHLNGSPLLGTRLFETEYFDLERIEVLRGPQGTLFGRNATSGVVNFVTAKPDASGFAASGEAEYGNYDSIKVKGMINVPIGETLAVRAAGVYVKRDGYTTNLFTGRDIDDRDLYAVRGSVRWQPTDTTTLDLYGYYFRENDSRARIQKQVCQRDPTGVLGCLNNRRDFGATNTNSTFTGVLGSSEFLVFNGVPGFFGIGGLYRPDANATFVNPPNVRTVNTDFDPEYFTSEQQYQARLEQEFGSFKLQLTGLYQKNEVDSRQDYTLNVASRAGLSSAPSATAPFGTGLNALAAAAAGQIPGLPGAFFTPITSAIIPGGPAGNLCVSDTDDPNGGAFAGNSICAATPLDLDRSRTRSRSYSIEGIVTSDFDGPFNFLVGGIYVNAKARDTDYYVNAFAIDYITGLLGTLGAAGRGLAPGFLATSYFRNQTPNFSLKSYGIFGEVYFDISDKLQFTGGIRYSNDKKGLTARSTLASFYAPFGTTDVFAGANVRAAGFDADPATACPTTSATGTQNSFVLGAPGSVAGCEAFQVRNVKYDEITGRAVLNYKITEDNLVYASYSRGYKSGGINPPLQPIFAVPTAFDPEIVNAFEIGSKNTFAGGAFTLNATAFYYQYKKLQLSRIVARTSVNDNVDADIYGVELESIIRPTRELAVNMNFSYLHTKVNEDKFLSNPRDPGGGRSDAVIIKDITNGSNCAVVSNTGNAAGVNAFVNAVNSLTNNLVVSAAAPGGLAPRTAANPNTAPLQGTTAFPADSGIASTGAFSVCSILSAAAGGAFAGFGLTPAAFGGATVLNEGVSVNIRGNKLPQAPNYKFSVGAQYTIEFDNGMSLVPRADVTYTGDSFGNIFNGRVNKIQGYAQANAQIQLNGNDDRWFVRGFIQNIFDNNAVTGLYVTDQSSGLFTNIFTLEPRRYGIAAGFKF